MRAGPRPPRWAESILERRLGGGLAAEGALGDLAEGYHRIRAARSGWRADLWYLRQGASLLAYRAGRRRDARGGRGGEGGGPGGGAGGGLAGDLRWAGRIALRRPLFTLGVALTLGLGLGANAAVFSVVDGSFRATSWWSEPDRTLALWPAHDFSRGELSFLMDEADGFEVVGAWTTTSVTLGRPGGEAPSAEAAVITPALFRSLRVQPALGRAFTDADGAPGAEATVVLGRRLWIAEFGADPAVVGRRVEVNGEPRTVVGVQGEGGRAPGLGTDLWLPLVLDPSLPGYFPDRELHAVGVAAPGVGPADALAEVRAWATGMNRRFSFFYRPDFGEGATVELAAARERALVRTPLLLLLGATAVLLLVAALNVGHMLLARSMERAEEIAVRRALGASRWRVVRQLAMEAAVLALAGAAVGLVLAAPVADVVSALWSADAPVARSPWTSPAVAAFVVGAAAVAWIVLAGVPVLHFLAADRRGPAQGVRSGGRRGPRVLVATQAALATVLLAAATLLVGSVRSLREIPLGFEPGNVTAFRLAPPASVAGEPGRVRRIQEAVVRRVAELPGVEAAGLTSTLPLDRVPLRFPVNPEVRPVDVGEAVMASRFAVDPGFFETLGVEASRGRVLDGSERGPGYTAVVVNRALARLLWPGEDPVGKGLAIDPHDWNTWVRVVGEVGDLRAEGLVGPPAPAFYVALSEVPLRETVLLVRGGPDAAALGPAVRRVVGEVDPVVPLGPPRALEAIVRGAYGTAWVTMGLLSILALLATALAAVGIHAALSHDVARRRRDMGIRLALGAARGELVSRVVVAGLVPTALGVVLGAAVALAGGGVLDGLLFGVSRGDPVVFAVTAATVLAAASVAAALPALRAGATPPARVLREE